MAKVSECFPVVGGLRQSMGPAASSGGNRGLSLQPSPPYDCAVSFSQSVPPSVAPSAFRSLPAVARVLSHSIGSACVMVAWWRRGPSSKNEILQGTLMHLEKGFGPTIRNIRPERFFFQST
jgi:hypothetical protein